MHCLRVLLQRSWDNVSMWRECNPLLRRPLEWLWQCDNMFWKMDVSQKKLPKPASYARCIVFLKTVGNHQETRFTGFQTFCRTRSHCQLLIFFVCRRSRSWQVGRRPRLCLVGIGRDESPSSAFFVRLDQARTFPLIGGAAQADDMACVAPMGSGSIASPLHRILAGGKTTPEAPVPFSWNRCDKGWCNGPMIRSKILIAWDGGHQCAIFRFSTRDVLRVGLGLNDLSCTGCHRCKALNFLLELRESADTHQLWCGLKFLESLLGRSETWSTSLSLYHSYCQHLLTKWIWILCGSICNIWSFTMEGRRMAKQKPACSLLGYLPADWTATTQFQSGGWLAQSKQHINTQDWEVWVKREALWTNPFHKREVKGVSILRDVSTSRFCFEVFCAKSRFSAGCRKLSGRDRVFFFQKLPTFSFFPGWCGFRSSSCGSIFVCTQYRFKRSPHDSSVWTFFWTYADVAEDSFLVIELKGCIPFTLLVHYQYAYTWFLVISFHKLPW